VNVKPVTEHEEFPVYDERNAHELEQEYVVDGVTLGRGVKQRDWAVEPCGSAPCAPTLEAKGIQKIDRAEWPERIADRKKYGAMLWKTAKDAGVKIKFQSNTNFCWSNAVAHAIEARRADQGQPTVELSPASVACKITGFRNSGGWPLKAARYAAAHGYVPVDLWPANSLDDVHDTPLADAQRKRFQIDQFVDLKQFSFDELMTCVLLNIPVATVYMWWRHVVTAMDPDIIDGRYMILHDNSWGRTWNKTGRLYLAEDKARPDEAIGCCLTTAA